MSDKNRPLPPTVADRLEHPPSVELLLDADHHDPPQRGENAEENDKRDLDRSTGVEPGEVNRSGSQTDRHPGGHEHHRDADPGP
ncbi:hypothetical protein [Nocardiopsis ansamitocini]|uniref:hypothetical protein n=1 Tax=Nocardiopsis ansamitocini TaxID=1670832 RepID=UPI0025575085|nr:hypothetical protein [Nocardiopsis ansamitocini]